MSRYSAPPRGLHRLLIAYRVTMAVVLSYFVVRLRLRLASGPQAAQLLRAAHRRNARRIHRAIERLGGLFIKVGQLISIMTNLLPEEFRQQLTTLQDRVPPRPYADIERRFSRGLLRANYTYTDAHEPARATGSAQRWAPYAPRHTWGLDGTWEDPAYGTWIALEGFFTGRQSLEENPYRTTGAPYVNVGFLATQRIGRYKLFFNVENVTDRRQGSWDPVVLPSRASDGRWTVRPWAPIDGRIFSAGIRIAGGDRDER